MFWKKNPKNKKKNKKKKKKKKTVFANFKQTETPKVLLFSLNTNKKKTVFANFIFIKIDHGDLRTETPKVLLFSLNAPGPTWRLTYMVFYYTVIYSVPLTIRPQTFTTAYSVTIRGAKTYNCICCDLWYNLNYPRWIIKFVSLLLLKETSARGRDIIARYPWCGIKRGDWYRFIFNVFLLFS